MTEIVCGEAREALRRLPAGHFHCVVSSPPFYGLRDYGLEPVIWGGSEDCEAHEWGEWQESHDEREAVKSGKTRTTDRYYGEESRRFDGNHQKHSAGAFCRRCNAWRGSLGNEPTPELYVAHIVEVMREVRRVLRDDGTLWLNMGDGYAGSGKGYSKSGSLGDYKQATNVGSWSGLPTAAVSLDGSSLKPKDLLMMPARIALALQQPYYTGRIKDERERIWLAAMVEAEGCLFIHKRKIGQNNGQGYRRKSDTYGAGLEVASTDRSIIERCMAIVGIGSICEQSPSQNRRRKQTIYRWNVRSNECRWIIRELYPHLVAKQHEARLLLSCPSSGPDAAAAHQSLKAIHQGGDPTIDFRPPETLFEPGWYLRSDIIWAKKNCMPESVTDRPTTSHEHVFLLAKSERYFYDADAIREPSQSGPSDVRKMLESQERIGGRHKDATDPLLAASSKTNIGRKRAVGGAPLSHKGSYFDMGKTAQHQLGRASQAPRAENSLGRNKRSVWTIATQPFGLDMCGSCKHIYDAASYRRLKAGSDPQCQTEVAQDEKCGGTAWVAEDGGATCVVCETHYTAAQLGKLPRAPKCRRCGESDWLSHFATFPEKLVEPCILAGTSEKGCCPECGAPWRRVVEREYFSRLEKGKHSQEPDTWKGSQARPRRRAVNGTFLPRTDDARPTVSQIYGVGGEVKRFGDGVFITTIGWRPTCGHGGEPVPCRVLDCFAGSGTVGVVAERLGRHSTLIELNPDYVALARARTAQMGLMAGGERKEHHDAT